MVALATTEVRGKANPFRDGPALLRSARADGWFPSLRDVMEALLLSQFNEAAKRVRKEESPFNEAFLLEWRDEIFNAQRPLTINMVREGILLAKDEFSGASLSEGFQGKQVEGEIVGEIIITPPGDVEELAFTQADFTKIDEHLNAVASSQTRQSGKVIQGVFEKAVDAELSPREIAKAILSKGVTSSKNRARMIARTETIWAYNRGALQTYKSIGVTTKEWQITVDDALCPWCASMDGVVVSVDSPFFGAGDSLNVVDKERSLTLNFRMAVEHPPLHPNCILPGTRVRFGELYGASRAWYEGPIVEIGLSDGRWFSVTVNHMMLTPDGFAIAELLRKGDQIIDCSLLERVVFGDPNDGDDPSLIEDVFASLHKSPGMTSMRVPVSSEHLHGDGNFIKDKINVVAANSFLMGNLPSSAAELARQRSLSESDIQGYLFSRESDLSSVLLSLSLAADSIMGSRRVAPVFLSRASGHHQPVGFQTGTDRDSELLEPSIDDSSIHTELLGESKDRHSIPIQTNNRLGRKRMLGPSGSNAIALEDTENSCHTNPELLRQACGRGSGLVQTADVLFCRRREFRGHVYDLHVLESSYTVNGLVSSNCRCVLLPVLTQVSVPVLIPT